MATIYRVTVTTENEGDYETLFELAGGPTLIGKLAPDAIIEAIATRTEAVHANVAERVMDGAMAAMPAPDGTPAPQAPAGEGDKPKRSRRTRAQIAADEAAQAAGFRDAAHQAEVTALQQPSRVADGAPETYVPPPAAVPAPSVATGDAAPPPANEPVFNPFAQ
jgi:hypothetical protein